MGWANKEGQLASQRNTTRNTCFDPQRAKAERQEQQRELEIARNIMYEQRKAADRAQHAAQMREHGRMLDQIERCYREHTPKQIQWAKDGNCIATIANGEVLRGAAELGIRLRANTVLREPDVTVTICPLDLTTMIGEGSL